MVWGLLEFGSIYTGLPDDGLQGPNPNFNLVCGFTVVLAGYRAPGSGFRNWQNKIQLNSVLFSFCRWLFVSKTNNSAVPPPPRLSIEVFRPG
jgi:hypothetical protein